MPQLRDARTPLGNLTSRILNSLTSLKVRSKVKNSTESPVGFRALKHSGLINIGDNTFESIFIDDAQYEHIDESQDDIYSGEFILLEGTFMYQQM
jgi:hypothetical protein